MTLVLDSSVTLAWFFRDEQTDAVREVLGTIGRSGAVVPSLWRIEVANALQMAIRRGRIDAGYRDASIAAISRSWTSSSMPKAIGRFGARRSISPTVSG